MSSSKDMLNRLKQVYNIQNNKELALYMGVNYNTLNVWINRDSIPFNKLYDIIRNENISFDWLVTGKGHKYIVVLDNDIESGAEIEKYKKGITTLEADLLESYRMLPQLKQDYYYHKIKSDAIELKFKDT